MKKVIMMLAALLLVVNMSADLPNVPSISHDGDAVYVLNNAGWNAMRLYMYGDENNLNGSWPGMEATGNAIDANTGLTWQYFDLGSGNSGKKEHLIFNSGDGTQISSAYEPYITLTSGGEVYYYVVNSTTDVEQVLPPVEVVGEALWPANVFFASNIPDKVRVLSMNNSLIHYENEWQDDMFNQMSAAMGKDAVWTAHTNLGKTLQYHYDEGEGLTSGGTPSARMLVKSEVWTHIILQEQTAKPRNNFAGFRESVKAWVEYIRANCPNPNVVIILPINWAYNTDPFAAVNAEFAHNYLELAQELGIVLTPVGVAYDQAYAADATILQSFFKDDRHPTQASTYLACCMEYATIFGVQPTSITWHPSTITESVALQMRNYAENAMNTFAQPINHINHSVKYEVRQVDANGMSVSVLEGENFSATGGEMNGNLFTCTQNGQYTISAQYNGQTLRSEVSMDTMRTILANVPAIIVDKDHLTITEDFDAMPYPSADAAVISKGVYGIGGELPEGWRIERNGTGPRMIGSFESAADTVQYQGGPDLPSNASNGTWSFGMNGSSDRAIGGMTTGVDGGARTINVMAHLRSDDVAINQMNISYDIEKYREGSNSNEFYVKLFTSRNGILWTEAGSDFCWINPKGSGQTGFSTVPGATQNVSGSMDIDVAAGSDLYLCWSICTSAGDNCASAPALAIDNVAIQLSAMPVSSVEENIVRLVEKRLVNGMLVIEKNGILYNALGMRIE